jgi:predicted RNA-binding Zn ribbon-like protein
MREETTFEFVAGNLALDFANTVHSHGLADPQDDLKTHGDLVAWVRQAGLLSEAESQQALRGAKNSTTDFRRFLRLRELVYALFSRLARGAKPAPDTLAGFSTCLGEVSAQPLVRRVKDGYELVWQTGEDPVARALGEITRSASDLLTSEKLRRVRQCAGESCSWLFLDTSRNGKRRWCDMQACGNRFKVRRFRQRERCARNN